MVKRLRFYVVIACTSEKTKNHNFDLEILEIPCPDLYGFQLTVSKGSLKLIEKNH